MLRHIIKCGNKNSILKNSKSLQFSTSFSCKKNEDKKDKYEFDEKRWNIDDLAEHPVGRTYRVMSKQCRQIRNRVLFWKDSKPTDRDEWGVDSANFPSHVDVLIIGNGAISNSIAYWLKKRGGESFSVIVIEQDESHEISPIAAANDLRMQYTLEENIEMALFSADFIRNVNHFLEIEGKPPIDLQYHTHGCLSLATEAGAEQLEFNSKVHNSMGIKNKLLTTNQLKEKFPWLNTDDIVLGCLGLEKEGSFNAKALNQALKNKAIALGVEYVTGKVKGFIFSKTPNLGISSEYKDEMYRSLNHVVVETADGEQKAVQYAMIVLAAGNDTLRIAKLAKIGKSTDILSVPLPIELRKHCMYSVHAPEGPGLNMPHIIDSSGCCFKRDGLANNYLMWSHSQDYSEKLSIDNFGADNNFFFNRILPQVAHRIPSFEKIDVHSSYATLYEYNTFDNNGIIGPHPLYTNMHFATGFGLNSVSYSPAIGRTISELILDRTYRTINLSRLAFDRFITLEQQLEIRVT